MARISAASSCMSTDSYGLEGASEGAPSSRDRDRAQWAVGRRSSGLMQCRVHGCTPRHLLDGSVTCEDCGSVIRPSANRQKVDADA